MLECHTVGRKVTLAVALMSFLDAASVAAQSCGDCNCYRPKEGCAAAPADVTADAAPAEEEEERPAAAAPPTIFAAPAPTGEVAGGRNSISLPSLRLSLPKISLETPEFSLHGFSRSRRNPQMLIDGAVAPASHQNPLLFGQLAGASVQPQQPQRQNAGAPAEAAPADADGCTSIESRKVRELTKQIVELQTLVARLSAAPGNKTQEVAGLRQPAQPPALSPSDPWKNSAEFEIKECEQQMAGLKSQISELQNLVEKLTTMDQTESKSVAKPGPSTGNRAKAVDPWRQDESASEDTVQDSLLISEQAARIASLEAKLEQIQKCQMSESTRVTANEEDPEPLIQQKQQQQVKKPSNAKGSGLRPGMLGKIGMSLSRR